MPKRKDRLEAIWARDSSHISRLIFNELDLYAKDKQFYPVRFALFNYMTRPQFNPMTRKNDPVRYPDLRRGTFDYWFERLISEGFVTVDFTSSAVRCEHLAIVERDGL